MPERKIKAGKAVPLDADSPAAKKAIHAEFEEAKSNLEKGGEGSKVEYDPATHANHSHLNP